MMTLQQKTTSSYQELVVFLYGVSLFGNVGKA